MLRLQFGERMQISPTLAWQAIALNLRSSLQFSVHCVELTYACCSKLFYGRNCTQCIVAQGIFPSLLLSPTTLSILLWDRNDQLRRVFFFFIQHFAPRNWFYKSNTILSLKWCWPNKCIACRHPRRRWNKNFVFLFFKLFHCHQHRSIIRKENVCANGKRVLP